MDWARLNLIVCQNPILIAGFSPVVMFGNMSGWVPGRMDFHIPMPGNGIYTDSVLAINHRDDYSVLDQYRYSFFCKAPFDCNVQNPELYIVTTELNLDVCAAVAAMYLSPDNFFYRKFCDRLRAIAYYSKYSFLPEELKYLKDYTVEIVQRYQKILEEYENLEFSYYFDEFLKDFDMALDIFPPFLRQELHKYFDECGAFQKCVFGLLDNIEYDLDKEWVDKEWVEEAENEEEGKNE